MGSGGGGGKQLALAEEGVEFEGGRGARVGEGESEGVGVTGVE
jgi:hypothetical protein